jgi:hypothetical protein
MGHPLNFHADTPSAQAHRPRSDVNRSGSARNARPPFASKNAGRAKQRGPEPRPLGMDLPGIPDPILP